MADESLRAKERRAKAGGPEERAAWLVELRRSGAPEVLEAEAFRERVEAALAGLRQAADERFASLESEAKVAPCPELSFEGFVVALETALRQREGFEGVGYGYESLASYWPAKALPYARQCGVFAFAAWLGDEVTIAADYSVTSKPTPGSTWLKLSGWRESLKPKTREGKLKAWVEAGREEGASGDLSGAWETLSLEQARLSVDLFRLPEGRIAAPAPIPAKQGKVSWRGVIRGVQPRLSLRRPDGEDEYFPAGYALRVEGSVDTLEREFVIGVGPGAQSKHGFRVGDTASGQAKSVEDASVVPVDFYRVSKLKLETRGPDPADLEAPPWRTTGPDPDEYRGLTPRKLVEGALTRDPCRACHWGCRVQVEGHPDHDQPLFSACFGPLDCSKFVPLD